MHISEGKEVKFLWESPGEKKLLQDISVHFRVNQVSDLRRI